MTKKSFGEVLIWGLVMVVGGLFWGLIKATSNLIEKFNKRSKKR